MDQLPSAAFFNALPKTELHAHLSGSISPGTLHTLWEARKSTNKDLNLADPLTALRQPDGKHHNLATFFPLFDKYIYSLVDDVESVRAATKGVIEAFRGDGVVYLELRTTPRELGGSGSDSGGRDEYVKTVCEAVGEYERHQQREIGKGSGRPKIVVRLILSVDRRMSLEQAMEVVELAAKYRYHTTNDSTNIENDQASASSTSALQPRGYVVAIDLCGNPTFNPTGGISLLTPAFTHARTRHNLPITVHFAEVPHSSSESELATLLSWQPGRLGHVIHVLDDGHVRSTIRDRKLALELCLSCNVLAEMTGGGYEGHHLGEWMGSGCPIALSTDDIAIFASPLSNEYRLAAQHFSLDREQIISLAESAAGATFDKEGGEYVVLLLRDFCAAQQQQQQHQQ
ncbi:Metallo-dependent hydrolase [Polychaeton citri CBS 116435]|uniref:Metallo-dependent hydrolase n=1 Tax=Polychaeton citri CBS 116435 TaxID=1314669 RepID=A0A9P4Q514_9PEZI|nr:Metallo-dependent hydrolase [Polychaeton citri CBS 116435]